ncbi:MAG: four helix bundle protein [Puniceicoccales bacterium]
MEFDTAEPFKAFENLQVWKRACRLTVSLYHELKHFPDRSLKDQMTRAAVSVASNIAEGYERNSTNDFIRFLRIAKGSTGELRTQLYLAQAIGFLSKEQSEPLVAECREISSMLQGFINKLRPPP